MEALFVLFLIVAALAWLGISAVEAGADSRVGVGDDHQRHVTGGVR